MWSIQETLSGKILAAAILAAMSFMALLATGCGRNTPETEVAEEEPGLPHGEELRRLFAGATEETDPRFERIEEIQRKLAELDRTDPATLPLLDEWASYYVDLGVALTMKDAPPFEPYEPDPAQWDVKLTGEQQQALEAHIQAADDFPFEEGCASEYYARAGEALERGLEAARETEPPAVSIVDYYRDSDTHEMVRPYLEEAWRRDLKDIGYFVDPPDTAALLVFLRIHFVPESMNEEQLSILWRHLSIILRETHEDGGRNALKVQLHNHIQTHFSELLFDEEHEW